MNADSFANNPQFAITLNDCDDDEIANVYIELSQMNAQSNKLNSIGFVVYPVCILSNIRFVYLFIFKDEIGRTISADI